MTQKPDTPKWEASRVERDNLTVNLAPTSICAVILTKNEAPSIARCIYGARLIADRVIVFDSSSEDGTEQIAANLGAEVVQFDWNGYYPKKKQAGLEYAAQYQCDWILLLDADEVVTPELAQNIREAIPGPHDAYAIPLSYYWRGAPLRWGQKVYKTALTRRGKGGYPEVGDLHLPGITEVEGHYQPQVSGTIGTLSAALIHEDLDPVSSWYARHNRYSDWEAHLRLDNRLRERVRGHRSRKGAVLDRIPFKPGAVFVYNYLIKQGFRDGRRGFEYAASLAAYQMMINVKVAELRSRPKRV